MRGLLIVGCIALGIVLVAAAHQDQGESEIEVKNEADVVTLREIRSADGKKKKGTKPPPKPPGWLSALARPPNTRNIRSIDLSVPQQGKRKRCPGCFTSLSFYTAKKEVDTPGLQRRQRRSIDQSGPQQGHPRNCHGCFTPLVSLTAKKEVDTPELQRRQRDTEEHEKLRKKHKHLKEKSKGRRRNKHKERHAHFQSEDPEIGDNNNKRRKHHRGKKDRDQRRSGRYSALARPEPEMNKMDNRDTQDMTE